MRGIDRRIGPRHGVSCIVQVQEGRCDAAACGHSYAAAYDGERCQHQLTSRANSTPPALCNNCMPYAFTHYAIAVSCPCFLIRGQLLLQGLWALCRQGAGSHPQW